MVHAVILTSYVAGPYFPRYYTHCSDCGKRLGPYVNKHNVKTRCFDCEGDKLMREAKEIIR